MAEQIIRANPTTINASPDNPISFDVTYNTANPSDPTLTGLGLRLHFNSQELDFTNLSNTLSAPLTLGPQESTETAQTDDGDPSTDSFILYSWTDLGSAWPGATQTYPVTLYTANFTALPSFDGATINFTRSSTASGYTLDAQPLQINLLTDTPPTISDITAQTTNEDTATAAIPFTIGDDQTPVADLQVTFTSSNTTLVPAANIALGGSGSDRTLTVTPAANLAGSSDITVTVTDGSNQATSDTFTLTVNPVNDLPTITDIANQTTAQNTATAALPFTIGDVETPVADLQVAVTSDNSTLVPNTNIALGGAGSDRTLTVTPADNQSGTANITVTVTDADGGTATDTFALTVEAPNQPPTADADTVQGTQNTPVTIPVATLLDGDTDPENDPLSITAVSNPQNGTVELQNGNVIFTPTADFIGNGTFDYSLSDSINPPVTGNVTVEITAPTPAGITVTPDKGLTTDETGKTATFTVKLDTQPTADVTIPVVSSNTAEGTVAPESLVFTSANWNTAQTVTVTGVADNTVDGDQAYTIELQAAVSTDTNYSGKDATDVSVTNTDVIPPTPAGITVAPTTGLTTDEAGKTATFTVKLDTQPTADVTIPVVSSNTAEGTVAPESLVFTSANWDTAQTVTVTGVADGIVDANQAYTIELQAATSTDTNYSGQDATDVSVTNTNVDVPISVEPSAGITVSPTTGLTTSESGTTATFTVKLDSQPTANVTIPVVSSNTAEGTAAPASLVFTAANWNTAQTVTVTGVADNTVDGDQAYTIELQPAVSTDANYKGKNATDVQVTNTNTDTNTLPPNPDEIDTLQGGEGADTFVLTGTPLTKPSIPSPTDFTEDQPNQLFGTDNDDVIIGSSGDETLLGFKGNDFLNGEGGGDQLFGGVDNDTLVGSSSDELLYGNKNSDLVFGGGGLDTLYGGQDDDTLTGESGSDLILGDKGNDVLYGVTDLGYTLISDFTPNQDVIQLTGSADNYRLTDAPAGTGVGTGIIRIDDQGNQQYIGVIEGVLMSQTSLTTSNFFQFV
ncbi:Mucin-5AC [Planktothrix tepida]|uniref:Putative Hemolysin-type calcium-binding region n=1 Tax=Planktothrix tepida PCC 9214 TaxID=671072 RepID=A0A1J1LMV7_9CYAN|nr:Ig-like domain-containing protein [Planktothrix tepida]CAD5981343.1 Mucin-5AC [Planktothrix tepida]CUR33775.1 putative Hemolysin-type calcium-binding region [Planktothrix tepida PCC 9214]